MLYIIEIKCLKHKDKNIRIELKSKNNLIRDIGNFRIKKTPNIKTYKTHC